MGGPIHPRKAWAFAVPEEGRYLLLNATVPVALVCGLCGPAPVMDSHGLARLDFLVEGGAITWAGAAGSFPGGEPPPVVDLSGGMVLPTFVDLHTHIDKGHTCERSPNPTGSLGGADQSTAADLRFWDLADVERRMEFSLRCAYAHGTSALRTHLINLVPKQVELTWAAFRKVRRRWAGRVELQAVSLVVLSFFRDEEGSRRLADIVQREGGVLGCAVCCSELGGCDGDEWTTCNGDRDELLDRVFSLAAERGLMLDFHVDENGNEAARGLRSICEATVRHSYQGRVVCGHCCSLALQPPAELARTLSLARRARVTVVSLPLVNEWTQDRDPEGLRTPRWRGITCLKELHAAGVSVAVASDNTRDQFYSYGDLDMLEVLAQSVRLGHLDRPSMEAWPRAATSGPAAAMGLQGSHGSLRVGGAADMILFRARNYSELFSRSQHDRVVVRGGAPIDAVCPDYSELDAGDGRGGADSESNPGAGAIVSHTASAQPFVGAVMARALAGAPGPSS